MISAAHLHLMINHVPLLGVLFGVVLLMVYLFRKNCKQVLIAGLAVIMFSGLFGVPAFYSGGFAEDIVEDQAHVSEPAIHEHEESAEVSVWVLGLASLFSLLFLFSIYYDKKVLVKGFVMATFLVSVAAIGLTARTANLGGQISHPELRDKAPPTNKENYEQESKENDED